MKNKKILSVAIATTLGVVSLVGVTTATKRISVLENGDIYICGTEYISNNGGAQGCITIQGKNVGASTTGAGQDAPVESYGNYYQWGDNTPHFYDCSNGNSYDDWGNPNYQPNNAWGGESDNDGLVYPVTNGNNRQGPCDPGYHVPSQGERYALMDMWAGESVNGYIGSDASQFYTDFQIPVADRVSDWGDLLFCDSSSVFLWSSSPVSYDSLLVRSLYGYDDDPRSVGEVWAGDSSTVDKNSGLPVRCFKNYDPNENGDSGSGSASTHVTLTLTAGSNTCTLNDYNLGTHNASAEEQYIESSGQEILCEFLQNTGVRVLLSMDNLSDGSKLIGAENFTGVVTAIGNSLGSISNLTGGNYNLSGSQEIYRKAVNTLGKWTGDLQIIGTIPAGTPSGTYTGSLEIVIQEG